MPVKTLNDVIFTPYLSLHHDVDLNEIYCSCLKSTNLKQNGSKVFYLFTNHSKSALFLFLGHLTKSPVFLLMVEWGECMVCDLWVVRMSVSGVRVVDVGWHSVHNVQSQASIFRPIARAPTIVMVYDPCVCMVVCLVMVQWFMTRVCVHGKAGLVMVYDPYVCTWWSVSGNGLWPVCVYMVKCVW